MKRPWKWTTEEVAKVCRRIASGERYADVAVDYRCSENAIYKVLLRSRAAPRQSKRKKWTKALVMEVHHKYYVERISLDDLTKEYGVSHASIKTVFHKNMLPFHNVQRSWRTSEIKAAHERIMAGEDQHKVASEYGVTYMRLYSAFRRYNLKTNIGFRKRRSRDSLGRRIWQLKREGKTYQECADIVAFWDGPKAKHNAAMTLRRYCERNALPMPTSGSASASASPRSVQADAQSNRHAG